MKYDSYRVKDYMNYCSSSLTLNVGNPITASSHCCGRSGLLACLLTHVSDIPQRPARARKVHPRRFTSALKSLIDSFIAISTLHIVERHFTLYHINECLTQDAFIALDIAHGNVGAGMAQQKLHGVHIAFCLGVHPGSERAPA